MSRPRRNTQEAVEGSRPRRNTPVIVPPPHEGDYVKVYVLVGKELLPAGECNIYCRVIYGDQNYSTKVVKDDNAPYWDEAFRVKMKEMKGIIRFETWNIVGADHRLLGVATINLGDIQIYDDWLVLHPENDSTAIAGEIRLTITNNIGM